MSRCPLVTPLTGGTKSPTVIPMLLETNMKLEYYLGQITKTTGTYPKTTGTYPKTTGTFVPVVTQLKYALPFTDSASPRF